MVYQNGGVGYVSEIGYRNGHSTSSTSGRSSLARRPRHRQQRHLPAQDHQHAVSSVSPAASRRRPICASARSTRRAEAESVLSYLSCRLTRLLILLHKPSQDTTRKVYTFVPPRTGRGGGRTRPLREVRHHDDEIAFIEKVVRPMELDEMSKPDRGPPAREAGGSPRASTPIRSRTRPTTGCSRSGRRRSDVKSRVDQQLKTAAIKNYTIHLDESAEREDGSVFTDLRCATA